MDHFPEGTPTWLVALVSVVATVAGAQSLKPLWKWIGRRLDADQQRRALERGDAIATLNAELKKAREEAMALRLELAEERELRMSFATDYAVLKERVETLTRVAAEDKLECDRAIRRLNGEVRRLNDRVIELSRQVGGPSA